MSNIADTVTDALIDAQLAGLAQGLQYAYENGWTPPAEAFETIIHVQSLSLAAQARGAIDPYPLP